MKSGIYDKNGKEAEEGDIIILPYVDPIGKPRELKGNREKEVKFKYGCFGVEDKYEFVPLLKFMRKEKEYDDRKDKYKTVYTDDYWIWIKEKGNKNDN